MKRSTAFVVAFVMLVLACGFVAFSDAVMKKNNDSDVVFIDGHLTEKTESMRLKMAEYAAGLFQKVKEEYLFENDCYFVLVPDKYMYLYGKKSDYDEFYSYIKENLSFVQMIDIYDLIDSDDYYFTDMHLRQENMVDIAQRISDCMKNTEKLSFEKVMVDVDFFGNYAKRYNRMVEPEEFFYLTNDTIKNLETVENVSIYDFEKLETDDPYEFFLSGNQSVVTIKNEKSESDKRLVIFRDSFASSFAPLLSENYSEIVLIDLRYIMSDMIGEYVDFENADILFMYSTRLINNSLCMR